MRQRLQLAARCSTQRSLSTRNVHERFDQTRKLVTRWNAEKTNLTPGLSDEPDRRSESRSGESRAKVDRSRLCCDFTKQLLALLARRAVSFARMPIELDANWAFELVCELRSESFLVGQ